MRVLLVVPEYPPNSSGGGGIAYEAIAMALAQRGHQITVLTGDHTGASGEENRDGISVYREPTFAPPASLPFLRGYLPAKNLVKSMLTLERLSRSADVVHIHSVASMFVDVCGLALLLLGRRFVVTNHGFPVRPLRGGGIAAFAFRAYVRVMTRSMVKGASKRSAISTFCSSDLPFIGLRVEIIPNGLASDDFPDMDGTEERTNVALFAGRITQDKGPLLVVEAAAQLPDLHVWIAGTDDGALHELLGRIEALNLGHRVKYLGALTRREVAQQMRAVRSVVMPSLNEPFGLVGLEAMANGAILVLSDRGGMSTYARDGVDAVSFTTGSVASLADALAKVHEPSFPAKEMAVAARERAEHFTWAKSAALYERWYLG